MDGLDGCFIGAGDMALVLGREYYGGPAMHPDVRTLVDRALDLVLGAGKLAILPAATGAEARVLAGRGVRLITMAFGALVQRACEEYFAAFRG